MARPTARERSETERNRAEAALLAQRRESEQLLGAQKQALNDFNLQQKQDAQAQAARQQRMQNVGTALRPARVFSPSSNRIANGFPPADDMVLIAGVIAVIGNVAKAHKDGTKVSPEKWVKLCLSIFILAVILGLVDRGSFSGPVRAFAALGLLGSVLYYTQYITSNKGKKNG